MATNTFLSMSDSSAKQQKTNSSGKSNELVDIFQQMNGLFRASNAKIETVSFPSNSRSWDPAKASKRKSPPELLPGTSPKFVATSTPTKNRAYRASQEAAPLFSKRLKLSPANALSKNDCRNAEYAADSINIKQEVNSLLKHSQRRVQSNSLGPDGTFVPSHTAERRDGLSKCDDLKEPINPTSAMKRPTNTPALLPSVREKKARGDLSQFDSLSSKITDEPVEDSTVTTSAVLRDKVGQDTAGKTGVQSMCANDDTVRATARNGVLPLEGKTHEALSRVPEQEVGYPFFDHWTEIEGEEYAVYKPVTGVYVLKVTREDLVGKIDAKCDGEGNLKTLQECKTWKERTDIIRKAVKDVVPAHIEGLNAGQFHCNQPPATKAGGRAGKRTKSKEYVVWEGPCQWNEMRDENGKRNKLGKKRLAERWKDPKDEHKCTTWWRATMLLDEIEKYALATDNVTVEIRFRIVGGICRHLKDNDKKLLRGEARKRKRDEVSVEDSTRGR